MSQHLVSLRIQELFHTLAFHTLIFFLPCPLDGLSPAKVAGENLPRMMVVAATCGNSVFVTSSPSSIAIRDIMPPGPVAKVSASPAWQESEC